MIATFVKREFNKKDWEHYSKLAGYQFIGKDMIGEGIVAAFSMPTEDGNVPAGYQFLNDDELLSYDNYCKGNNHYPRPFKDEIRENTIFEKDEGGSGKIDAIKDWLQKKKGMFKV